MNVQNWVQMVTVPVRTVAHATIMTEVTRVLVQLDGRVINVKRVRHKLTAQFKINLRSTAKEYSLHDLRCEIDHIQLCIRTKKCLNHDIRDKKTFLCVSGAYLVTTIIKPW